MIQSFPVIFGAIAGIKFTSGGTTAAAILRWHHCMSRWGGRLVQGMMTIYLLPEILQIA